MTTKHACRLDIQRMTQQNGDRQETNSEPMRLMSSTDQLSHNGSQDAGRGAVTGHLGHEGHAQGQDQQHQPRLETRKAGQVGSDPGR